jgi:serine/threonine-protein kinase HipA
MPQTHYFDLSPRFAAFGTQRFDVMDEQRVPVQSLAAVFGADFRIPSARWRLSPGYDLTFSNGAGGEHYLDVCGEGKFVTRANLLDLAKVPPFPRPTPAP